MDWWSTDRAQLNRIEKRLMATQDQVDALKATVDQLGGDLATAVSGIQSDLDALKKANPAVDISALEASVATLSTAVQGAQAVDAENPPA